MTVSVSETPRTKMTIRHALILAAIAICAASISVPIAAHAAEITYWDGAALGGSNKSSSQASMTGGKGFAVTAQTFRITNAYGSGIGVGGSVSSGGNTATFFHQRATVYSGCSWVRNPASPSVLVGMNCKYLN